MFKASIETPFLSILSVPKILYASNISVLSSSGIRSFSINVLISFDFFDNSSVFSKSIPKSIFSISSLMFVINISNACAVIINPGGTGNLLLYISPNDAPLPPTTGMSLL